MSNEVTTDSIDAIDPNHLGDDELYLLEVKYEMFPNQRTLLFKNKTHLVVWSDYLSKFSKKIEYSQKEFPLMSLPWFIDTLVNEFWNYETDLSRPPGDVSESALINEEKIGINPMRHCCAENLFGYSFWNKSRKNNVSGLAPQSWEIPSYMLENGLLDQLKELSTKLGLKSYL